MREGLKNFAFLLAFSEFFCYDTTVVSARHKKIVKKSVLGGVMMAKCAICGKGVQFGAKVSHSHRRSNKIWSANVQKVRCKVGGGNKRMNVCTRCLRSGKVERA